VGYYGPGEGGNVDIVYFCRHGLHEVHFRLNQREIEGRHDDLGGNLD